MRLHDINKYIKESYQPILNEYNNQIPFTEKLKNELIEAVSCNSDIDDFPVIVEVINKYYPDNEWYEVTSIDIPNELYRYDSSDVIDHIVSNLKIETCNYEDKSEYDLESLNEDIVSKITNVANKVGNKIIQGTQSTLKAVNNFNNAKNQNTTTNNTSNTTKTNLSNNTQNNNSQPVNIEYRSNDPIWMIQYDDGGKLVTQYSPGANANKAIANAKAGGALENNTRIKKVAKVKDSIQSADAFRKLAKEFLKDGSLTADEFSKLKEAFNEHPSEINYKGYIIKFGRDGRAVILNKDFKIVKNDIGSEEEGREFIDSLQECANKELQEDTVKIRNGKWTNQGDSGKTHGTFRTKKEADAQRKAMYANGFKESWQQEANIPGVGWSAPTFYDYTDEIVSAKEYLKDHPENRIATKELKTIEGKLKEDYKKLDEFNYYWTKRYVAMTKFIDEQLSKISEEFR